MRKKQDSAERKEKSTDLKSTLVKSMWEIREPVKTFWAYKSSQGFRMQTGGFILARNPGR